MKTNYLRIIIAVMVLYIVFISFRTISTSLFFSHGDRITILFYGTNSQLLSLDLKDNVNYIIDFDNEMAALVPGGYGRYKFGALGRLSEIEKNPKILLNTFSSAISGYVPYYVTPQKNAVYDEEFQHARAGIPKINLLTVFNSSHLRTNARFTDRLFLFFTLINKRRSDFIPLSGSLHDPSKSTLYSEESFQKKYKGFFYEKRLRAEGKNIRIVYGTYSATKTLSRIIEGIGIRVVDVSYLGDKMIPAGCTILDSSKSNLTSVTLSKLFDCQIKHGQISGADIELILGQKLERDWE